MRVATFNLHAGVDGWGRPTEALKHIVRLNADILVLPELWRGDHGDDQFDDVRRQLGMEGVFVPLARAERTTTGVGGRSWQPLLAHFNGEHGLYFDEHRSLTRSQEARRRAHGGVESGDWGLALLTKCSIEDIQVIDLGRLPREKVRRATIVATLRDGEHLFRLIAVHGAHLSHGSYRQYRRLNQIAASLGDATPIVMAGDFNSWRPLLRFFLPDWRSMARARTWPARHPHSQIDHIFARGSVKSRGGRASDGGSDHRALVADLEWS